ncbi:ABC transporter substrate-binding protein [Desertihabitans aurantiacus]|uniref:ABC transporter substrate-binding protein n=1 Tax=Desertihabitans aurantiacus TaxID=2282477 RepID=UPI000DF7E98E|nr:ABC transporter substrate-binding protein [Desertihabitans aurantiacus]
MALGRQPRRVAAAALSSGVLLALAACGGGGGGGGGEEAAPGGGASAPGTDPAYEQRGPITMVQGKDTSGNVQNMIDMWNADHPDEQVTLIELSDEADQQRNQMIQNAETQGSEYTILSMDVVWTAEFAANQYVDALPKDKVDLTGFLQPTIDSVTYFDQLYGIPTTSDGGLLYYRSDWLEQAGVEVPTTYDEMKAACETVKAEVPEAEGADCYGGQHQKYEGLTVNISEAVDGAGGHITDDSGAPTANTPEAVAGLTWMRDAFADGTIPQAALTWTEEEGRQAFQDSKLVFHRNWPYVYNLASESDISGKFAVAPLPGLNGPGVSSLGGHNWAISKFAENKGTALDFMIWLAAEEQQKSNALATSQAPTRESLYSDPEVVEAYPYMETLKASIETARPRPKVVNYGDVTLAIQDATYTTLQGNAEPQAAFADLQTKLEGLIQ